MKVEQGRVVKLVAGSLEGGQDMINNRDCRVEKRLCVCACAQIFMVGEQAWGCVELLKGATFRLENFKMCTHTNAQIRRAGTKREEMG